MVGRRLRPRARAKCMIVDSSVWPPPHASILDQITDVGYEGRELCLAVVLHGTLVPWANGFGRVLQRSRKSETSFETTSSCSICGRWPALSISSTRALAMRLANSSPQGGGGGAGPTGPEDHRGGP